MQKIEGDFHDNTDYKEGLGLFFKLLAAADAANKFYARLSNSQTVENITFRTSTALGKGVEGTTEMYVQVGSANNQDVDVDTFNFTGVTDKTPRTLRITEGSFFTNKYPPPKIAATLVHEFLVHGAPFATLFDSIKTSTSSAEMAAFWRKSRASDNSGPHQHALFGARKTQGLEEILAALQNGKSVGISNKDAAAILKELERDIEEHKRMYPLKGLAAAV